MHATDHYRLDPQSAPSPDRPPKGWIETLKRKIEQKKMQKFDKELKKRLTGMTVIAIFFIAALTIGSIFAATRDAIIFDASYGKVEFSHQKHSEIYKIDCLDCHHTWKKCEMAGKMCKDCHKTKPEGKTLSAKEVFHKNCKGCHDKLKKANKPAGPISCTQCHKKK